MRIDIYSSPDLFVVYRKEIEAILRTAIRDAITEHKQAGRPIAIWKSGRVELIKPEEETGIEPVAGTEQT